MEKLETLNCRSLLSKKGTW